MAAAHSGKMKRLTITTCSVDAATGKISLGKNEFKVMLNPKGYDHNYEIIYSEPKGIGQNSGEPKFSGIKPDKFKCDIWIDGTGVVRDNDSNPPKALPDVKTQLKALHGVIGKYDGEDHEPKVVRLLWGSMIFFGRLESMKTSYKLFKPSGEPLRAMVSLSFISFLSKGEEALKSNRSSPDLTHVVEVKSGDTLPLLCNKVYKDCSYYLAVAEVNGIGHFRDIKPGQKLYFPPLS